MAKREKQQIVSKKHMARQEREALQVRYITYGSIILLVLVVILTGYALVNAYILIPNKSVATVNNVKILAEEYQSRVKFERSQLINQMINTANMMYSFGSDPDTQAYFQNSIEQIRLQLTPEIHGQSVIDTMVDDELIQQEADRLSVSVSDAEIDKYIAEAFGYYPDGTPTPVPTSEPVPTTTLNPAQLTLAVPTATQVISDTAVVAPTETPIIEPTPTQDPLATPTEVPPTATPYTEDAFKENYQSTLDSLRQATGVTEADFRRIIYLQILREKIYEEVTKDVPAEQGQTWARHILVGTEEEAQSVIARLEAGEDFATLAKELSTDTVSAEIGGDLDWFGSGQMVAPFEDAATALKDGEISQPVESQFGWHVIQKLGYRLQTVDAYTHEQIKQTYFSDWLAEQRNNSKIEKSDIWLEIYPETPVIPEGL